jgi:hypothetical protein
VKLLGAVLFLVLSACSLLIGGLDEVRTSTVDAGVVNVNEGGAQSADAADGATKLCVGAELVCDDFEGPRNSPGTLLEVPPRGGGTARISRAQGSMDNSVLQIRLPPHSGAEQPTANQYVSFPPTMAVAVDLDMRVVVNGGGDYYQPTIQLSTVVNIGGVGARTESVYSAHNRSNLLLAEQAYASDGGVSYPVSTEALIFPSGWVHVRFEVRMVERTSLIRVGTRELRMPLVGVRSEPRTTLVLGITSSKDQPNETLVEFDNVVARAL